MRMPSKRLFPWLVACALIAVAKESIAQIPETSLHMGDKVRYELTNPVEDVPRKSEATYLSRTLTGITVSVAKGSNPYHSVELPIALIGDLDVSRGTESWRWPGLLVGGLAGCAIAMFAPDGGEDDIPILRCPVGLMVGGGAGFLLGSLVNSPKWVGVEFD